MTTLLYSHPACFDHDPGRMHPESPARLKAVLAALDAPEFKDLERREAPLAETGQIARVHDSDYVTSALAAVPKSGHFGLDPDTVVSPGSGEAARMVLSTRRRLWRRSRSATSTTPVGQR